MTRGKMRLNPWRCEECTKGGWLLVWACEISRLESSWLYWVQKEQVEESINIVIAFPPFAGFRCRNEEYRTAFEHQSCWMRSVFIFGLLNKVMESPRL
jgi:hypothetical protein